MTDYNTKGLGSRALPQPQSGDAVYTPYRTDRYGHSYQRQLPGRRHNLADSGAYFIAHNATNDASTTLAGHAAPVLADADATLTKPFIFLRMDPAAGQVRAYLDFIEIEVVTAGANGTQACWAAQVDTGTSRASGGTALTRVNPNMQSSATPQLACTGGAITAAAETANVRDLGFGTLRPSIEIAGDVKMFVFDGDPEIVGSQAGQAAAAIRTSIVMLPPVILGPTDSFLLALHGQASQSAAGVYKVRLGWWEI